MQSIETVTVESICRRLPPAPTFKAGIRRAPKRLSVLDTADMSLAVRNALRYVPPKWHSRLAPEFLEELHTRGRIYAYRFRPAGKLRGRPIDRYSGACTEGRAFQVMIDNNLDFDVALYPYELVTYGETGQVCQNWLQYRLIKAYLEILTDRQTLVVASGHPLGLFRSSPQAPRVVITNGLMVGLYDHNDGFNRAAALGVANYGQMTAGGWMYIGPQGIVHGTYSTLLNAARGHLGIPADQDLLGRLFVSSGLGGMSGAQGKAVEIANGVGIIAEVDRSRIETRYKQGWVSQVVDTPDKAFETAQHAQTTGSPAAIAFNGNIVDLLAHACKKNIAIDLLSDQTSCHVVYDGGYCPQGLTFEQRTEMLKNNPGEFRKRVNASLKTHFNLIRILVDRGSYFFDYGNTFMKSVFDAGVKKICRNGKNPNDGFIFPSYVEDIMGPLLFDYGYGPFRWVCLSGKLEDLDKTDRAAMTCIDPDRRAEDRDNYIWIRDARKNKLVVGTKARILYQDSEGRMKIALRFNQMVRQGEIGPIMLGRDHHDTGGTDSPFRETANIKDGSQVMADMAVHCFAGNAARGMSLAALHNGGGVGIGNAINGGFGLVLDGSSRVDKIIRSAVSWDVMVGVARRSWARNPNAMKTAAAFNLKNAATDWITLPYIADEEIIKKSLENSKI
jgi:urocanate hydratase